VSLAPFFFLSDGAIVRCPFFSSDISESPSLVLCLFSFSCLTIFLGLVGGRPPLGRDSTPLLSVQRTRPPPSPLFLVPRPTRSCSRRGRAAHLLWVPLRENLSFSSRLRSADPFLSRKQPSLRHEASYSPPSSLLSAEDDASSPNAERRLSDRPSFPQKAEKSLLLCGETTCLFRESMFLSSFPSQDEDKYPPSSEWFEERLYPGEEG